MATRINIMKLLQEVNGMAQITNRRGQARPSAPALLQLRSIKWKPGRATQSKRIIRIAMQDPPDIPHPVRIVHCPAPAPI